MDKLTPLTKVPGMTVKIRGYLRSMHPELGNRIKVEQLLEKYPQMQAFVDAISSQMGPTANTRSLNSMKGNVARAYALILGESGGSSLKRKAVGQPDTVPAAKEQRVMDATATPADLVQMMTVNETREAPILEQLALERDMNQPFGAGRETAPTGEAVENTREPVPSWSQRSKNFPNVSAEATEKALDMAEADPLRQTKELTVLPTFVDNALLTQQDDYYLRHRNANSLAQTSFSTPAAALTNNYADGVREGIRRRDTDVDMEEEKQDQRLAEGQSAAPEGWQGGGGGGRQTVGKRAVPLARYEPTPTRSSLVAESVAMLGRGLDNMSTQVANAVKQAYTKDQIAIVEENRNRYKQFVPKATEEELNRYFPMPSAVAEQLRQRGVEVASSVGSTILGQIAGSVGKAAEVGAVRYDIMNRARSMGFKDDQIARYLEQVGSQTVPQTGMPQEVDQLRPFLPMAGSSDVELRPGENEQKMRNEALFNDYKPANWPLGNKDNALYLQNLVLQGIRWESPLDNIPPVLPGGSLLQGAQEFTSDIPLPDISTLQLIAMEKQMEFKAPKSARRVLLHNLKKMAEGMRTSITQDVKYLYNPYGGGGDNPQIYNPSELNPLHTTMFPVLQVGGSEPLRNLNGPVDAFAKDSQIGQRFAPVPIQSYVSGPYYNIFAARPGYH